MMRSKTSWTEHEQDYHRDTRVWSLECREGAQQQWVELSGRAHCEFSALQRQGATRLGSALEGVRQKSYSLQDLNLRPPRY